MTDLRLFGISDERVNTQTPSSGGILRDVRITHAIRVQPTRAGQTPDYLIADLQDDDVIEMTFAGQDGDVRRWMTVAEIKAEFQPNLARGSRRNELILPGTLPAGGQTRGAMSLVLKAFRVFDFDPVEGFASSLAELCDQKLMTNPGLFFFHQGLDKRGHLVSPDDLDPNKPTLLFIHGTFSNIRSCYGNLDESTWADLEKSYGRQIIGFDHPT